MGAIYSPMPGIIAKIWVKEGDEIKNGDVIVTLQIMKAEYPIPSSESGVIKKILVKEGDEVEQGTKLIEI